MAMRAPSLKPADSSAWLPLALVAAKLGVNAGALRRKCAARWSHAGLARQVAGQWEIHPSADPRLRDARTPTQRDLEASAALAAEGVAPKYLDIARSRRDLVAGFASHAARLRHRSRHDQIDAYLAAHRAAGGAEVSRATFYNWERSYELDGLRGLIPNFAFRDKSAERAAVGEAALDYMERLLNAGNRIRLPVAIQLAQAEALKPDHTADPDWAIGSYSAVRVALAARRPKMLRVLADKGPRAARAACVPKVERDFEQIAAGEEYCGDERHLDLWCRVLTSRGWRAIRPWLTAWQDMRSRMIVGWMLAPHANRFTILGALDRAIRAHGKPERIRTDRGKDYRAAGKHGRLRPAQLDAIREKNARAKSRGKPLPFEKLPGVAGILESLGIGVTMVEAYTPWAKPIESQFRTMKTHFDALYGGFWGGCPSERHEDRARYVQEHLERLPTLEAVAAEFDKFLDVYHAQPHSAVDLFGKSPSAAMEAFRRGPIRRETDAALDFLFREFTEPKLVRRDGVRHNGRWYGWGDPRLIAMQGQRVLLALRAADQGRALVCSLDRSPLFEVELATFSGLSREQVAQMVRANRALLKPFAQQAKNARTWLLNEKPSDLLDARLRVLKGDSGGPGAPPVNFAPGGTGVPPVSITTARPALESQLAAAAPTPVDAIHEAPAMAALTGTDDASIDLAEIAFGDSAPPVVRPAARETLIDIMDVLED